jgi:hypothetical protein
VRKANPKSEVRSPNRSFRRSLNYANRLQRLAQTFKSAVSRISKSAGRCPSQCAADLDLGETAGLETCAVPVGFRVSGFHRISDFGFRISPAIIALLAALTSPLLAAAQPSNKIPDLKPPAELIAPTYWEQFGIATVIVAIIAVAAAGLVIWRSRRPQPAVAIPPEVIARSTLGALQGRAEDERVLREVSRAVRRYVVAAFRLSQDEPTAEELVVTLAQLPKHDARLVAALRELLAECDAGKFAPTPQPAKPALVLRALELVNNFESQRNPVAGPPPLTAAATRPK